MPKKSILQDIKPISRTEKSVAEIKSTPKKPAPVLPREIPFEPIETKSSPRYTLWYVAGICLVAFVFSLSFLFESAKVTVTQKVMAVDFDASDKFVAEKDTNASDTVSFTQMTLTGTETIKLPGTQSKKLDEHATGTVVIYNAYRTTGYPLAKSTRLLSADNKLYRTVSAVTVPGYKKSGTGILPGSIEAKVIADVAGDAGNIDHADFTLPGLKGTAQETKIYGRTKTAISGGVTGDMYTISQSSADAALGELSNKLKASLYSKAKVQVPDGYLFFEGATVFKTDSSVSVPYSKEEQVPLVLKGSLSAYLIKESTLSSAIIKSMVSQYGGEDITIPKLNSLTLTPSSTLNPDADTSFKFTLGGHAVLLWSVDTKNIQESLAGAKKTQFDSLISTVIAVDKATAVIKPFWKRTFPTNLEKIKVVVQTPEV